LRKKLARYQESDASHFRRLGAVLRELAQNPRSGERLREDLPNHYYVELGSFWLFYLVDEEKRKVRVYELERVFLSW